MWLEISLHLSRHRLSDDGMGLEDDIWRRIARNFKYR